MAKFEITDKEISYEFKIMAMYKATGLNLSLVKACLQVPTTPESKKVKVEVSFRTLISFNLPDIIPDVI
ncbi:MAG TPA: hypothetical protein VH415_12685 [Nitrososphaeraceae archaeon]